MIQRKALISLLLLMLPAVTAAPAGAEAVKIFASDTTACHNTGLLPIKIYDGWLQGLDVAGEWVEYHFSISGFGVNASRITAMGTLGVPFNIRMMLTGENDYTMQSLDFNFIGAGFSG
jgi:hypothetical protein